MPLRELGSLPAALPTSAPCRGDPLPARLVVLASGSGTTLQALLDATLADFAALYARLDGACDVAIDAILPGDKVFTRGTQAYALGRAKEDHCTD